jgi:hypothetical protein
LGGLVAIALAAAIAWWWTHPPDPVRTLREHWSPLARLERTPRPDLGEGIERWRLHDARGRTVQGIWRPARLPSGAARQVWTVVLMGGLHTGDRAAFLIPAHLPVHVLAMDWPWDGPREMDQARFVAMIPAIRRAILDTPACLAIAVDAAAAQPEVDATRIALIGVSLGVPAATGAIRLTDSPTAVVLVDGAVDLEKTLEADLRARGDTRWLAAPLASLASRLTDAMEPSHHLEALVDYPTLLVNSRDDDRLVPETILALHAALPGAAHVWRDGEHVRPEEAEILAALVRDIHGWLASDPSVR